MKKLISLILALVMSATVALSLVSCGEEEIVFEPVASTAEESRVVMSFNIGGTVYNVKYELYRALFVSNHDAVDNGDASVWSSSEKNEKIAEINKIIKDRAAEIYSVLHLASQQNIDVYSDEADDEFYSYLYLSVYGGYDSTGAKVTGHGTYEKYLDSLKKRGMNYSVSELLFRYSYAYSKLQTALTAQVNPSESDVKNYYYSNDCARILSAYYQKELFKPDRLDEIRQKLREYAEDGQLDLACYYIINTMSIKDIEHSAVIDSNKNPVGIPVGFYEFDDYYYEEYTAAAFSLDHGQVSRIISVNDVDAGYYILIGLEKTDAYYNSYKSIIRTSYIQNTVGRRFYTAKANLLKSAGSWTSVLDQIDHSAMVK